MSAVDKLIDSSVHCIKCGKKGIGTCDCWEQCSCRTWNEPGTFCRNPKTTRCSGKIKYGRYDRKLKRYLPRDENDTP